MKLQKKVASLLILLALILSAAALSGCVDKSSLAPYILVRLLTDPALRQ
jgi:hypothetical protein